VKDKDQLVQAKTSISEQHGTALVRKVKMLRYTFQFDREKGRARMYLHFLFFVDDSE
jgi:hypothetical protein